MQLSVAVGAQHDALFNLFFSLRILAAAHQFVDFVVAWASDDVVKIKCSGVVLPAVGTA